MGGGGGPRTKKTLPDFLKWRRVTRPPFVFRGLTSSQRTPGFWGVTRGGGGGGGGGRVVGHYLEDIFKIMSSNNADLIVQE